TEVGLRRRGKVEARDDAGDVGMLERAQFREGGKGERIAVAIGQDEESGNPHVEGIALPYAVKPIGLLASVANHPGIGDLCPLSEHRLRYPCLHLRRAYNPPLRRLQYMERQRLSGRIGRRKTVEGGARTRYSPGGIDDAPPLGKADDGTPGFQWDIDLLRIDFNCREKGCEQKKNGCACKFHSALILRI